MIPKKQYRDSLFVSMFGKSVNSKENFLSLYNAIHNSNLKIGEVDIQPFYLENIVYTGVYNDVSMIIDGKIVVLAEHQSRVNNNMPLRCLQYYVELLNRKEILKDKHKYNKKEIPLFNPEFYVFYNGEEDVPDITELKLSDAFIKTEYSTENSLELTVKMYNINLGKNKKLFQKCQALNAYSFFVAYAKEGKKIGAENFLTYALDKCKNSPDLSSYFEGFSKEDSMFLIGDYDFEMDKQVTREEAIEETKLEDAVIAVNEFCVAPEIVAAKYEISLDSLLTALKK